MSKPLRDHLLTIAAPVQDHLEFQHWISGDDADAGPSYCFECAEKLVAANSGKDMVVDGGWNQESDTPQLCETCGRFLEYTLTGAGVESELDHFEDCEIALTPEVANELLQLIDSAEHMPQHAEQLEALKARARAKLSTTASEE